MTIEQLKDLAKMYEEINDAIFASHKPLDLDAYYEDWLMSGFEAQSPKQEEMENVG